MAFLINKLSRSTHTEESIHQEKSSGCLKVVVVLRGLAVVSHNGAVIKAKRSLTHFPFL